MNFQNVNANYLLAIIKIIILSLNEKKKDKYSSVFIILLIHLANFTGLGC